MVKVTCYDCNETFNSKWAHKQHASAVGHARRPQPFVTQTTPLPTDHMARFLYCFECGETFGQMQSLTAVRYGVLVWSTERVEALKYHG